MRTRTTYMSTLEGDGGDISGSGPPYHKDVMEHVQVEGGHRKSCNVQAMAPDVHDGAGQVREIDIGKELGTIIELEWDCEDLVKQAS